jgi:hypothetical protein
VEPRGDLAMNVRPTPVWVLGLISNRIDLLSEVDVSYKSVGLRISGAAWYDAVYNQSNDNDSPATANSFSVPHNRFTDATRKLHGRKAEIPDAFVFANGRIGNMPASVRTGKHTLLWGQSLLIATNGMSYAQAPIDGIKALSVPNTPSKELFMPVGQVSAQVSPTIDLSFGAYYQYDWRKARIPPAGSYFGTSDILDDGGERLLAGAGRAFFRGRDVQARDSGQWGVSTRYRSQALDSEFGLYTMRLALLADAWDAQGRLWHTSSALPVAVPELPALVSPSYVIYDFVRNGYVASSLLSEGKRHYQVVPRRPENEFSADRLAAEGVR